MAKPRLTKAEQAERTRRNLIDAAGRLYLEHGFASVSLDDIAAEAGVTKGAVYAHFASKEELVIALMATVEPTVFDLSMFGSGASFGEEVRAFARSTVDAGDPRTIAVQAEYLSLALRNPRAGEVFSRIIHRTLTELGDRVGTTSGLDRRFAGTDAVVLIDALLQGLAIRRALNPELVTERVVEDAVGLLVSALVIGVVDPDEAIALREVRDDGPDGER